MSNFIDYNDINPKLKLLSERFNFIHEEYVKNKNNLEFKDFSKKQEYNKFCHAKNNSTKSLESFYFIKLSKSFMRK